MNAPAASDSSRGYDVVRNATRILPATYGKSPARSSEADSEPGSEPAEDGGDAVGERGAVEAVEAERLRWRPAGGPALDAVDGHRPLQLAAQGVAERPDGGVVLDDEDLLERRDGVPDPGR